MRVGQELNTGALKHWPLPFTLNKGSPVSYTHFRSAHRKLSCLAGAVLFSASNVFDCHKAGKQGGEALIAETITVEGRRVRHSD